MPKKNKILTILSVNKLIQKFLESHLSIQMEAQCIISSMTNLAAMSSAPLTMGKFFELSFTDSS